MGHSTSPSQSFRSNRSTPPTPERQPACVPPCPSRIPALVARCHADCGAESFRGSRVGGVEGNDRELGEREVTGGSEGGEGAEERELPVVETKLLHEKDVSRIQWAGGGEIGRRSRGADRL